METKRTYINFCFVVVILVGVFSLSSDLFISFRRFFSWKLFFCFKTELVRALKMLCEFPAPSLFASEMNHT